MRSLKCSIQYIVLLSLCIQGLACTESIGGRRCHKDADCSSVSFCDLHRKMCRLHRASCLPQSERSCYTGQAGTAFKGLCHTGRQICTKRRTWSSCMHEQTPRQETCDGLDNNCDGQIDESCHSSSYCKQAQLEQSLSSTFTHQSNRSFTWTFRWNFQHAQMGWERSPHITIMPANWSIDSISFLPRLDRRTLRLTLHSATIPKPDSLPSVRIKGEVRTQIESTKQCSLVYTVKASSLCSAGQTYCTDRCTFTAQDRQNCGRCGQVCTLPNSACLQGKCVCPQASHTLCNGVCINTQTSHQHCGRCDRRCPTEMQCKQGTCVCSGTLQACGDTCFDLQNSPTHCGVCNRTCSKEHTCVQGQCQCTDPKKTECLNQCVDLKTNVQHCGHCGRGCASGHICSNGSCLQVCTHSAECAFQNECREGVCIVCPGDPRCDRFIWLSDQETTHVRALQADSQGHIYIAGEAGVKGQLGPYSLQTRGGTDLFFAKLHESGQWKWLRQAGGAGLDYSSQLYLNPRGSLYSTGVYGRFNQNATFFYTSTKSTTLSPISSTHSIFLLKYTHKGTKEYALSLGGKLRSWFPFMAHARDGSIYSIFGIEGSIQKPGILCNGKDLHQKADPLHPLYITVISKLSEDGKCLWARTIASQQFGHVQPRASLTDSMDHLYVAGLMQKDAVFGKHKVKGDPKNYSLYLTKMTPAGVFTWARSILLLGTSQHNVLRMVRDTQNNIYIAVHFHENVTLGSKQLTPRHTSGTQPQQIATDGLLIKLDPQGQVIWYKQLGGVGKDRISDISVSPSGKLYVLGTFSESMNLDGYTLQSRGKLDSFIARLDPKTGKTHWFETCGGADSDTITRLTWGPNEQAYILVSSRSTQLTCGKVKIQSTALSGKMHRRIWSIKPHLMNQ